MPTQLQLEGPDLETLLSRVRSEHGTGARIVQAEKVRSGGVGGFFAKQHFEITVEVEAEPAPAEPAPPRMTSILDLADEVSATERSAAVSTESTGFAAVLARLGATAGDSVPTAAAVAPEPGPAAATPAPLPRPAAAAPRIPAQRRGGSAAPSAGARRSAVAVRARGVVAARPAAPAPVRQPRAAARRPATPPASADRLQEQLVQLGLPEHLRPTGRGALQPALAQSLRALPKAPRTVNRPGSVLALVGPAAQATEVAHQMARELALPRRAAVVIASPSDVPSAARAVPSLRTPQDARQRRSAWRRRKHLTIVVVDTSLTALGAARARALLEALEPTSTWGVVEATRKPRDVGAWTRAVGGVDALALTCVDETADPASVLQLGIPVGRLGTRRATPAGWASLLADRVAA